MSKAIKLALEALQKSLPRLAPYGEQDWLDSKASIKALEEELKQEQGEPVWCGHCNGSGRMVRDPDIGTDQEFFVCDGAGVPEAPKQKQGEPADLYYKDLICPHYGGSVLLYDVAITEEEKLENSQQLTSKMNCSNNFKQDEPVAWADYGVLKWIADKQFRHAALLYTTPQPKQEPVAWRHDMGEENGGWEYFEEAFCPNCQPLYISPQPRKPLTKERILHLVDTHVGPVNPKYPLDNSDWIDFARAIEIDHDIKE
jgi:hypothetical protein